ncbi:peroxidase [Dactylonectria estremocensis]|uniref:Peroxidase n=1 Tax=Dactylonectria estremocensis TaxID=1079267 RepID=A0A9P9J5E1_9HYPO|nr:peroxidase [Dactylonectria estremocensis]
MKFTSILATALAVVPVPGVTARPSMEEKISELSARAWNFNDFDSNQVLGDLRYLNWWKLSSSGRAIKNILQGNGNPQSRERYWSVARLESNRCRRDTCCVWKYISDDLEELFRGDSGRCSKWARFAIRMGFHDAATWTLAGEAAGGGADGSIILGGELSRRENSGISDMGAQYQKIYAKYHDTYGFSDVTYADLIQMGANIATVVCPLGPRVRSWVGRKDSSTPAPPNLLPSPFSDADTLIQLFMDKTIGPDGLIALLGAHTTSQQNFVNKTRAGDPQDSTPGVWDVLYYQQTLGQAATPERVFMFPSDINLSKHPRTAPAFQAFAGAGGQGIWNDDYAREYIRLSLLGVNNINQLTECTKVLPQPVSTWAAPDQGRVNKWLDSDDYSSKSKEVSWEVENGYEISTPADKIPGWSGNRPRRHRNKWGGFTW